MKRGGLGRPFFAAGPRFRADLLDDQIFVDAGHARDLRRHVARARLQYFVAS